LPAQVGRGSKGTVKYGILQGHDLNAASAKLAAFACMTGLAMLCLPAQGASDVTDADKNSTLGLGAPAEDVDAAVPALNLWRSLTVSQGTTRHHYREPDPLGRVRPLDSETGSVPTTQVSLRWRGKVDHALPELALQAQASYAQGQTAYRGYLQQGNTLTPYSASTGNTLKTWSLRVGLPLNAFTRQPWARRIAPYAEQSWHRWQRELTQYGETFAWQTTTLGVMAVWPLAELGLPQLARFVLETDLAVGRSRRSHITVPAMGFAADLGEAGVQSASLALHYAVTPTWLLGLRYAAQRKNFGASHRVLGLQYPGASYSGQGLLVSVGAHF